MRSVHVATVLLVSFTANMGIAIRSAMRGHPPYDLSKVRALPRAHRLPSEKRSGAAAGGRTRWAGGSSAWRGRCSSGTGSGRARRADAEGSREFESVKAYCAFVAGVVARRNARGSTSPGPAIHGS